MMGDRNYTFRAAFTTQFAALKRKYGCGQYSWTEGINRRIARKIARKKARQAVRERERIG